MGNNTIEANEKLAYEICHRWSIEVGGDVEPFFELFHDDATFTTMAIQAVFGPFMRKAIGGLKTVLERPAEPILL
jgi:hypothetical protein